MPHSYGQVPATHQLSTGQLDILEHETTKYTPNDLLLLFIKDLLVMGNQYHPKACLNTFQMSTNVYGVSIES
jgi:hypothetical protein